MPRFARAIHARVTQPLQPATAAAARRRHLPCGMMHAWVRLIMRTTLLSSLACCLLAACATKPPAPPAEVSSITTTTRAVTAEAPRCEMVCEGAEVIAQVPEQPDYHARAVADANAVFGSIHDELLACYAKRLRVDPNAHAYLTVDVVIGRDGRVQRTELTGGARLGKEAIACIVERVEGATFEPVAGGGTRRVHVPLTFRRVGPDET